MTQKNPDGTVKLNVQPKASQEAMAKVKTPKPKVVTAAAAVVSGDVIKKPAFLDNAVGRSGVKRRDAKPAIEAALMELGEALMRGDELNLPPLGKVKVIKSKDLSEGAQVLTVKIRTMKDGAGHGASPDKSGVAADGDEG